MLIYTILVTSSLLESQHSKSAFLFSNALLNYIKNSIHSIFFYSNGVFNGTTMIEPENGMNLTDKWYNLSKLFTINLYICSSAAQDRGLKSAYTVKEDIRLSLGNVHHGFQLVGSGQLVHAILNSDRFLQF